MTSKRTTHRSSKGRKLYAVRTKKGKFEDIQTYKKAHGSDVKRKAKAEKPSRYGHYDYLGAMEDCNAAVDVLAKLVIRTGDPSSAWWLCANHAQRVNCYSPANRKTLHGIVASYRDPPTGGTWKQWFARTAVKATHSVRL